MSRVHLHGGSPCRLSWKRHAKQRAADKDDSARIRLFAKPALHYSTEGSAIIHVDSKRPISPWVQEYQYSSSTVAWDLVKDGNVESFRERIGVIFIVGRTPFGRFFRVSTTRTQERLLHRRRHKSKTQLSISKIMTAASLWTAIFCYLPVGVVRVVFAALDRADYDEASSCGQEGSPPIRHWLLGTGIAFVIMAGALMMSSCFSTTEDRGIFGIVSGCSPCYYQRCSGW